MSRTERKEFSTTLSVDERAALGTPPGRILRALIRAMRAGDVKRLEQHLAAVDAETAATRSGSGRLGGLVKHHGPDAKKQLHSVSTRASDVHEPGKTQDKPRRNKAKQKKMKGLAK